MWSKITKILDAQVITTPDANVVNTAIVRTQRLVDERGVLFSTFDASPGAAGTLSMHGSLSDDAPIAPVADSAGVAITLNMANHSPLVFGTLLTNLPILPRVQFKSTNVTTTSERLLSMWLVE